MSTRPIKFRAFDSRTGKRCMIDNVQDGSDLRSQSFGQYLSYPNTYAIMQFTGLHDKNGKEIYEGDIVNTGTRKFGVAKVVFCNGQFCGESNITVFDLPVSKTSVIGNIYANPELLK